MRKILVIDLLVLMFPAIFTGCQSNESFQMNSASPTGMYRVHLSARVEPTLCFPWNLCTQTVGLEVWKNARSVVTDDTYFLGDSLDEPFSQRFPVRDWISNTTFRLTDQASQGSQSSITIRNSGKQNLDLVIVHNDRYERFLVFDIPPGEQIAVPTVHHDVPKSSAFTIHYRAYSSSGLTSGNVTPDGPSHGPPILEIKG